MRRAISPLQMAVYKASCIDAIRAGNTRTAAARYAGIDDVTFYRWLNKDRQFRSDIEKAEATAEVAHVANVLQASNNGSWQASAWWLERRRRADYGRADIPNEGQQGQLKHTTIVVLTDDMSKPELPIIEAEFIPGLPEGTGGGTE